MAREFDVGDAIVRDAYRRWIAAGSPKRAFVQFLWSSERRFETGLMKEHTKSSAQLRPAVSA